MFPNLSVKNYNFLLIGNENTTFKIKTILIYFVCDVVNLKCIFKCYGSQFSKVFIPLDFFLYVVYFVILLRFKINPL